MDFLNDLILALEENRIPANKLPMENYMKNHFEFYGVRSPQRKEVFRSVWKKHGLPQRESYKGEILQMMNHPKREVNYCAIDLAIRCQKTYSDKSDLPWIKEMIETRSWWDSVDSIAPNLLGKYLLDFPEEKDRVISSFIQSKNMWLLRSCLIFQLKYKEKTDQYLLFALCKKFADSKEFFIQKAIAWALRQQAYINPTQVYYFIDNTPLANLSIREANKHRKS